MASKSKDNDDAVDETLKEEIEGIVHDLEATGLEDSAARCLLQQLVVHATADEGNISTVPKALQFLVEHVEALEAVYNGYIDKDGQDSYSLALLLDLLSFLTAIKPPSKSNCKKEDGSTLDVLVPVDTLEHAMHFKMLLYKIEANIVITRLYGSPNLSKEELELLQKREINDWGNEYLISLAAQIVSFFGLEETRDTNNTYLHYDGSTIRPIDKESTVIHKIDTLLVIDECLKIVDAVTLYWFQHGFEYDAIDILLEVDRVELLLEKCGDDYDLITRTTNYLLAMSSYTATPSESLRILYTIYELFIRNDRRPEALRIALKLNDFEKITRVILSCSNVNARKQLALMCESNGLHLNYTKDNLIDQDLSLTDAELEQLNLLSSGEHRSGYFLTLCAELDVLDPKDPADIFKSYPNAKANYGVSPNIINQPTGISIDSAKENLAHSFVNAFVNCGFGTDKLINVDNSSWVFKHQDYGLLCASASVGILNLWNINEGLSQVDKYQYSNDPYVKAGAFAAFGLASCGVVAESDPISGLLLEQLDNYNSVERLGAILGLGFGYAGSCRETLLELLTPCILDDSITNTLECSVFASISLALVFVGTGSQEASEAIIQTILEKETSSPVFLDSPLAHMYACALALLQLGRMDACEPLLEALDAIQHPIGRFASVAVESFAYAGSSDVIHIQKLLKCCVTTELSVVAKAVEKQQDQEQESAVDDGDQPSQTEEAMDVDQPPNESGKIPDKSAKVAFSQGDDVEPENARMGSAESSMAILGIPLICLTEPVGSAMMLRLLDHPLQYGSAFERRAVPLALALANVSNPHPQIIDMLSKLTHDADSDVSLHSILALGIVGSGTNNSRIAAVMQTIAKNNVRNPVYMFVVRIAVGLLYMGKGTTTISPVHSDGFLVNKISLGGLMVVLMACLNMKSTVLDKIPYVLLYFALAIRPRWLITITPDLDHVQVPVRVGTSVDTTGTAGKPRTISGFQTHTTPVLVGSSERAELANEDYSACTNILEGIVVVEKNTSVNVEA